MTGSHNPPDHNGFKICVGKATIHGEQIQEIRKIMEARDYRAAASLGGEEHYEIIPAYLTVSNPVDNGGTLVLSIPQERRLEILDLIAADPNVDVLVVGLTAPLGPMTAALANDVLKWAPTAPIPAHVLAPASVAQLRHSVVREMPSCRAALVRLPSARRRTARHVAA